MGLSHLDQGLWFASATLAAGVVWRILHERLFVPPFKTFVFMLCVLIARDVVLSMLGYDSNAYTWAWALSLPVLLAAQAWAGLDALRSVAKLYPKFGGFAVRLFLICLAITVAFCCLGLPFELHRVHGVEASIRTLFLLEHSVDAWIAGTLVLVAAFLVRSPAPAKQPPRNLVLHTVLLSLYFGGYAVQFFAENLVPLGAVVGLERVQYLLVVFLYAVWASCLSARGQNSEPWPQIDVILLQSLHPKQSK